jgi:hypothetical protein
MKPEKKNETNVPIATCGTMPPSDCFSMPVTASGLVIMASCADLEAGVAQKTPVSCKADEERGGRGAGP